MSAAQEIFDVIREGNTARLGALLTADPSLAGVRNESARADGRASVAPLRPVSDSEAVGPRSVRAGGRASRVEISGDLLSPFCSSQGSYPNGRARYDPCTDFS